MNRDHTRTNLKNLPISFPIFPPNSLEPNKKTNQNSNQVYTSICRKRRRRSHRLCANWTPLKKTDLRPSRFRIRRRRERWELKAERNPRTTIRIELSKSPEIYINQVVLIIKKQPLGLVSYEDRSDCSRLDSMTVTCLLGFTRNGDVVERTIRRWVWQSDGCAMAVFWDFITVGN